MTIWEGFEGIGTRGTFLAFTSLWEVGVVVHIRTKRYSYTRQTCQALLVSATNIFVPLSLYAQPHVEPLQQTVPHTIVKYS